jgi:predicted CXXCH cytochrome family protein
MPCAPADARPAPGPDVHRPDAACQGCHTADAAALGRDPAAARSALVPDIDARCMSCHGGEGPSHKTGVMPRGAVPANLPLSSNGQIMCATCHFVHGEGERSRDYQRIDNRRGQLCLTCHKMSELQ